MRQIGFIGAGKVGTALGLYLSRAGYPVKGYYSRTYGSAQTSAEITGTSAYENIEDIAAACDVLFLSVPDAAIRSVSDQLAATPVDLTGKWVIHLSGAATSDIFSDMRGAYGISLHPAMAVSDSEKACREFPSAVFTIEGRSAEETQKAKEYFEGAGLSVLTIDKERKSLYHLACVFSSNLACGLYEAALDILHEAGFSRYEAGRIVGPLFMANARALADKGPEAALTGPVERADLKTVERHLDVIPTEYRDIYIDLSQELIRIARAKNPDRDYDELEEYLKKEK